jgi:hypothetical protein
MALRHSFESRYPKMAGQAGFPRIKYGAGSSFRDLCAEGQKGDYGITSGWRGTREEKN